MNHLAHRPNAPKHGPNAQVPPDTYQNGTDQDSQNTENFNSLRYFLSGFENSVNHPSAVQRIDRDTVEKALHQTSYR